MTGIKNEEEAQVPLVSSEISFPLGFSTFSNVMRLPKREENKETCMGDHVSVKPRPLSVLMEDREARQAHRMYSRVPIQI